MLEKIKRHTQQVNKSLIFFSSMTLIMSKSVNKIENKWNSSVIKRPVSEASAKKIHLPVNIASPLFNIIA
ncbi:hypothetical protein J8TS2_01640 [Lederbergia ruris]|uniref:Uncharacterized protein n=1 Tax=Lederbergia ruris TaxID=217495 RepID=A0ABQ4KCY5_9BACI|nr:hypothetical protein J8TS2_01640 [Lederbergia ruris]